MKVMMFSWAYFNRRFGAQKLKGFFKAPLGKCTRNMREKKQVEALEELHVNDPFRAWPLDKGAAADCVPWTHLQQAPAIT